MAARQAGQHPALVWVIYGDDWGRRPAGAPSVCLKGADRPEQYDWAVLAGVPVHVVPRVGAGCGLRLAAEIARVAAPVVLHWVAGEEDWPNAPGRPAQAELAEAMLTERVRLGDWPAYWSGALQQDYDRRRERYQAAVIADSLREVGRRQVA